METEHTPVPAEHTSVAEQIPVASTEWSSAKVYILSVITLLLGVALGALFHGPAQAVPAAVATTVPAGMPQIPPASGSNPHMGGGVPTAVNDPVFEKLKGDPKNFDLLMQAGTLSLRAQDAKAAVGYYSRALEVKNDTDARINLANACFRGGEADRSLAELATVLQADPKNDKALYNTGVVRLMAKNDPKGAVASWQMLLKYYPNHPHKQQVEEMIKRVKTAQAKGEFK